jgi:hypothetical protein
MFYLPEAPSSPMTPYPTPPPLHHTGYVYTVYLFTQVRGRGGGELIREKVRGAIVYKAGRKYQHD